MKRHMRPTGVPLAVVVLVVVMAGWSRPSVATHHGFDATLAAPTPFAVATLAKAPARAAPAAADEVVVAQRRVRRGAGRRGARRVRGAHVRRAPARAHRRSVRRAPAHANRRVVHRRPHRVRPRHTRRVIRPVAPVRHYRPRPARKVYHRPYRRGYYKPYRRGYYDPLAVGVIGLATGAIVAGAVTAPRTVVVAPGIPAPYTAEWYRRCSLKYRSFRASDGTYLTYRGVRRTCRLP